MADGGSKSPDAYPEYDEPPDGFSRERKPPSGFSRERKPPDTSRERESPDTRERKPPDTCPRGNPKERDPASLLEPPISGAYGHVGLLA